jgi:hypothetical protein
MANREQRRQVAIYGWGVVAPGARDVATFRAMVERATTALAPARGELGDGLFAVGEPDFDIEAYRDFIVARHGEPRFNQLKSKMGDNALFALGACIQALESNPGLEAAVREADLGTHVYIGSGVGDLPQSYAARAALDQATRVWNRFWADRTRCAALRAFLDERHLPPGPPPPVDPATLPVDSEERFAARVAWDAFWARHSDARAQFERAYAEIERTPIGDDTEKGPLHAIKKRQSLHRKLLDETGCPTPPWQAVDPKLVWAIQNVPAAQITMLLETHGASWAPVGACSTFGVALKCGRDAITRGEAKVAIVGTTDPRPDPALISAFHRARLTPATGDVNYPLTSLLGTHVAGGACTWIIADVEYMAARGLRPIGPTIEGIGLSSDAEHIITPSASGPKNAIRAALAEAGATPETIAAWDMHATGTPGDASELRLIREFVGPQTRVSARKGLFGHGMANAGGWELTVLAMGLTEARALPTGVSPEAVHPALRAQYGETLVTHGGAVQGRHAVKLMMGIGGITACVVLGARA